jgi:hypothetical protein
VHRHVEAAPGELAQHRVEPGDVVAVAGERGADDGDYADRVLVDLRPELLGADGEAPRPQRHLARLDLEVAAELVPDDVDVGAVDEVRPVDRLAGGLAGGLPAPLHGQRSEHHRF